MQKQLRGRSLKWFTVQTRSALTVASNFAENRKFSRWKKKKKESQHVDVQHVIEIGRKGRLVARPSRSSLDSHINDPTELPWARARCIDRFNWMGHPRASPIFAASAPLLLRVCIPRRISRQISKTVLVRGKTEQDLCFASIRTGTVTLRGSNVSSESRFWIISVNQIHTGFYSTLWRDPTEDCSRF